MIKREDRLTKIVNREFNLPDNFSYLNCSTMGPQPKSASQLASEILQDKEQPWKFTHEVFFQLPEDLRANLAKLTSSQPKNFALIPSVGYGISLAASTLAGRVKPGSVLILDEQFPSNVYPWTHLKKFGFQIKTLQRDLSKPLDDQILEALTPEVSILAIPNVHWSDGHELDLSVVVPAAQSRGIPVLVDGVQSLGVKPTEFIGYEPDFYVTGFYKWMLGPYGLGAMYVQDKYFDAEPFDHAWMNRVGSENLRQLTDYTEGLKDNAARFDMGGKSFVNVALANQSVEVILEMGVESMYRYVSSLSDELESKLKGLGFGLLETQHRCGHIVGVKARNKNWDPELVEKLQERSISVALRGERLRVSPNIYNHSGDIDRLVNALEDLA